MEITLKEYRNEFMKTVTCHINFSLKVYTVRKSKSTYCYPVWTFNALSNIDKLVPRLLQFLHFCSEVKFLEIPSHMTSGFKT